MKAKSLIFLLLLTAGVFSYVYFEIEKPAKQKELSGGKEDVLPTGDLTLMQSVKITTPSQTIELKRQKVGWKLASPVDDIAAQSKVENLISALEKFKKIKVLINPTILAKDNPNLAQYGLLPPKLKIEYKTSDSPTPVTFSVGEQNPSHTGVYANTTKDGLVLATMDLDYLSTQTADDFREMRFTTVPASDFEEVEINYLGKKMKFKKDGDQWKMLSPLQAPIDQELTRSTFDKISFIRANQFLTAKNPALKKPDIQILVGFKKDVKDLRTSESDPRPQGFEVALVKVKKPKNNSSKDKKSKPVADEFEYFAKGDKTSEGSIAQFHYDNLTKTPESFLKKPDPPKAPAPAVPQVPAPRPPEKDIKTP